jgi:hypothetical protein
LEYQNGMVLDKVVGLTVVVVVMYQAEAQDLDEKARHPEENVIDNNKLNKHGK